MCQEWVLLYFAFVEFELREDLRMDEVELRLEFVTAGVVWRERLLVHHQMLCAAGKPVTQQTRHTQTHDQIPVITRVQLYLSIQLLYWSVFSTDSGVMWTTRAAESSDPPVWYLHTCNIIRCIQRKRASCLCWKCFFTFVRCDWCRAAVWSPLTDSRPLWRQVQDQMECTAPQAGSETHAAHSAGKADPTVFRSTLESLGTTSV